MLEEKEKGTPEGQENVVFVNTALIWRAMEQVQRSQADFRALLEQAHEDPAVAYDVGLRYAQGDGVDADLKEAAHWFAVGAETGICITNYGTVLSEMPQFKGIYNKA